MKNNIGKNLKTISGHVKLEMLDEVLSFHQKGNIIIDEKFNRRVAPYPIDLDQLAALERSDFEISPFHEDSISCASDKDKKILRNRTAKKFSDNMIDFNVTKNLLNHTFSSNKQGARPYPSGGALYTVEVIAIIFEDRLINSPKSGFYHFRPTLNALQPIKLADCNEMRQTLFRMDGLETQKPNFAFLYCMVLSKALVKYRYRGYRYSFMEAGSMYHQADLIAQSEGLINKIYSGFNDNELMKYIGLDRLTFLPLVIQSFG